MNCYFCQQPLVNRRRCENHPTDVKYFTDNITTYIAFYLDRYSIYLFLDKQELLITYRKDDQSKDILYRGPIIKNIAPENASEVINRLLNMKVFL